MFSQTISRFVKGVTEFAVKHSAKIKGSGNVKSETYPQPPYNKVVLKVPATATVVVCAGVNEITVTADDNFHECLKVKVKSGELVIGKSREFDVDSISQIKIEIKVPKALEGISVFGSGVINANDSAAVAKDAAVDVNGSGKISLSVRDLKEVVANVFGSGSVVMNGVAVLLKGSVNGSGSLNLQKLICQKAKVDVFGSGLINVSASKELNAEMVGSGNIFYSGNPQVKTSVSGSGKIINNNLNN